MKFGGASLSNVDQLHAIADLIAKKLRSVTNLIVVVSAMGKTTDELISLAHSVNSCPPQREYDMLLSVGERISMALLAMALATKNIQAMSLTGSQSGIITCTTHGYARIIDIRPRRILQGLQVGNVVIVAGFQGVSSNGEITTLGRGGSDTSAVALGIALEADAVEFYKDVPGFFTKDPKVFADAKLLQELSYDEALAILKNGGRILHARAVSMAKQHNIPLVIRPFLEDPNLPFSRIHNPNVRREKIKSYEQNLEITGVL